VYLNSFSEAIREIIANSDPFTWWEYMSGKWGFFFKFWIPTKSKWYKRTLVSFLERNKQISCKFYWWTHLRVCSPQTKHNHFRYQNPYSVWVK
jgi:hypothetical protein